ncbi:stage II sporulation protein M [Halpernia frigidisoli]|uniref:Stage II sporulation protein M n=1 Tax=Halpernia frigidisoli TaxID=1125876 RepID=A0A1I3DF48_9FLAO|nr:stage II sporulation protein M [Halpernia frigidisoli]SFH85091.1 Stage II sporulation protein M [Halpernia frigidisoli]
MKKLFLLSFLVFSCGFFYYPLSNESYNKDKKKEKIENSFRPKKNIYGDTNKNFFQIFLNNLFIGFLLSILGFLSGGLLTILILFWNGYLLSIVYSMAFYSLNITDILYYSKHIPIELFALMLFSNIGYKGFYFYKDFLINRNLTKTYLPKISDFIIPISLLFISSIIESL